MRTSRDQQCPAPEQSGRYVHQFPKGGMPYGLPPLSDAEHSLLARWLAGGTPNSAAQPLHART